MLASDIMTTPVPSVRLAAPVTEVVEAATCHGFVAVVAEGDLLAGLVTEEGLASVVVPAGAEPAVAAELMATPVTTVPVGAVVDAVWLTMLTTGTRVLPVVDGCRVVGMVTWCDVARSRTPVAAGPAAVLRRAR